MISILHLLSFRTTLLVIFCHLDPLLLLLLFLLNFFLQFSQLNQNLPHPVALLGRNEKCLRCYFLTKYPILQLTILQTIFLVKNDHPPPLLENIAFKLSELFL